MKVIFCFIFIIYGVNYTFSDESYRLVCYYNAVEAWRYRKGKGVFVPKDIDPNKCTHLHYAYAKINRKTFLIEPEDEWAEIDNKMYSKVNELREQNPTLRILLSVGGWTESSETFSRLISDENRRNAFLTDTLRFLSLYDFDGLDISWFFPVCWDGDCRRQYKNDKRNFRLWINEMREEFDRREIRLLLTITMPHDYNVISNAYDIETLYKFDYINVMTFDYAPDWYGKTGHNAPLYATQRSFGNVDATMKYYASLGILRNKLIMGIPTFGRSHTLQNSLYSSVGAPVIGPGKEGELTRVEGLLASYEICDRINTEEWTKAISSEGYPYAYMDDQWISYDDDTVAAAKAKYVMSEKFGGIMIWDIDRDDFRGSCFGTKFPLITAVINQLYGVNNSVSFPDLRSDRINKSIDKRKLLL